MHVHIKIVGVLLIVLAFSHIYFPRRFNWNEELKTLSLINRQMMKVHMFFIALLVLLIGVLCLTSADQLIQTSLGRKISFGLGVFWATRLFFQLFIYSPKLWKGKTLETVIHVLFTILWVYISVVFIVTALM